MIKPVILATARLVLRPLVESDFEDIVSFAGDERVAEWTTVIPHPLTREDVAEWHAGTNHTGAGPGEHVFAITIKDEGLLAGVGSLTVASDGAPAEIGYWIGQPHWGHGYATEAVRRLTVHGFGTLKLLRIDAPVFEGNARSARVLEKAGFEARGQQTLDAPARGGTREAIIYKMERADFARVILSQAVGRE
ncbi:MAG: RimJ/RimL family protein N-acetyltransferase [Alphaproteobacteria bacterium]|jgi:RimJ/RimL family protein N-acetyltransferase